MPSLVFELAQVYHISRERARGFLKKVEKSLSRWAGPFAGPKRFWKRFAMCEAFASRWCGKGLCKALGLSRSAPMAGTSLEALCLPRSIPLPLVRARGAHCKTAAHETMAKPMKDHSREGPRLSRPMRRAGLERKNMKWFRNGTSFLLSCSESVTTQEEGGKANQEQHT